MASRNWILRMSWRRPRPLPPKTCFSFFCGYGESKLRQGRCFATSVVAFFKLYKSACFQFHCDLRKAHRDVSWAKQITMAGKMGGRVDQVLEGS